MQQQRAAMCRPGVRKVQQQRVGRHSTSRLDYETCRQEFIASWKHLDRFMLSGPNMSIGWFVHGETCRQHCCRSAGWWTFTRSKNRALHSPTKSPISPDLGRIMRCGQQRNCSQQAKEQIGIKITEIARVELQISRKNRGAGQLCTVPVFCL